MMSDDRRSVNFLLVYAVGSLRNREAAEVANSVLANDVTPVSNLKPLFHVVHKLQRVNMLHPKAQINVALKAIHSCAFNVLGALTEEVWFVRIFQPHVVGHCMQIDANRSRMFYGYEAYPMRLGEDKFRCFGGNKADNLNFTEVRKVVRTFN